jgi:hypothetical protein
MPAGVAGAASWSAILKGVDGRNKSGHNEVVREFRPQFVAGGHRGIALPVALGRRRDQV